MNSRFVPSATLLAVCASIVSADLHPDLVYEGVITPVPDLGGAGDPSNDFRVYLNDDGSYAVDILVSSFPRLSAIGWGQLGSSNFADTGYTPLATRDTWGVGLASDGFPVVLDGAGAQTYDFRKYDGTTWNTLPGLPVDKPDLGTGEIGWVSGVPYAVQTSAASLFQLPSTSADEYLDGPTAGYISFRQSDTQWRENGVTAGFGRLAQTGAVAPWQFIVVENDGTKHVIAQSDETFGGGLFINDALFNSAVSNDGHVVFVASSAFGGPKHLWLASTTEAPAIIATAGADGVNFFRGASFLGQYAVNNHGDVLFVASTVNGDAVFLYNSETRDLTTLMTRRDALNGVPGEAEFQGMIFPPEVAKMAVAINDDRQIVINASATGFYANPNTPGGFDFTPGFYTYSMQLGSTTCVGDANGDLTVNVGDFIAVLLNFGTGVAGDANGDLVVNVSDFIAVLLNFGNACN